MAPMVIIDLRGNGGGDSSFSDQLAALLEGDERVKAARISAATCHGSYWRASSTSIETAMSELKSAQERQDSDASQNWSMLIEGLKKAMSNQQSFYPNLPECASRPDTSDKMQPVGQLPPSKMRGRLILVTDHKCFSSCLLAVDLFRRLGARQVGETTDKSTRYMEVYETLLPSGVRTFSTLQKVAVGAGDFGPYVPDQTFPGNMANTSDLKAWIKALKSSP